MLPPDRDAQRQAFVAAFLAQETVPPERVDASWIAIERAITRRRRAITWGTVLAVAAAIVAWVFLRPPERATAVPILARAPALEIAEHPRTVWPPLESGTVVSSPMQDVETPPEELSSLRATSSRQRFDRAANRHEHGSLRVDTSRRAPAPPSPSDSALAAETALYRAIRAALASHEPGRALVLLEEHTQRFPTGAFRTEAEAARVRALCALGRTADAERFTAQVLRAKSHPTLAATLASACAANEKPR